MSVCERQKSFFHFWMHMRFIRVSHHARTKYQAVNCWNSESKFDCEALKRSYLQAWIVIYNREVIRIHSEHCWSYKGPDSIATDTKLHWGRIIILCILSNIYNVAMVSYKICVNWYDHVSCINYLYEKSGTKFNRNPLSSLWYGTYQRHNPRHWVFIKDALQGEKLVERSRSHGHSPSRRRASLWPSVFGVRATER